MNKLLQIIKEILTKFLTVGLIIGSIYFIRFIGFKGLLGFSFGVTLTTFALIKRNNMFLMLYKVLGGDRNYTDMLFGRNQEKRIDDSEDIYNTGVNDGKK